MFTIFLFLANSVELRQERQRSKDLEGELTEYKQLIAKSGDQKLIATAARVEQLNNQLNMAIERANAAHKKASKDSHAEESYLDQLKTKIEQLEKQNSELLAKETFKIVKNGNSNTPSIPSAEELEHCCVVLASVEAQTNRLCKQMERLDNPQKEERRRSLSKETNSSIAIDLASVMAELKVIHQVLETHKLNNPNLIKTSTEQQSEVGHCSACKEKQQCIEAIKEDIVFYKKKNKELTNQVLQTEDRWTVEIEKQTHNYRTKVRKINSINKLQYNFLGKPP